MSVGKMSKQENDKPVDQNEPVTRDPINKTPERSQSHNVETAKTVKVVKPVKRRGFFATVFSHLAVATIAVIGVGAYLHWDDILTYTGSRVCSYDVLGKYAKTPVKVPPIDTKSEETQTTPKAESKAQEKSAAPKAAAEVEKPKTPSFEDALQAARKQFWENDKAAVPAYEALVASKSKDADLQAEMANVYLKNDDQENAIKTFFSAGKMYLEQKQTKKANVILDILKKISPEKSAELSKLMNTASN